MPIVTRPEDFYREEEVIDLAFEFVGAPGQQFTVRPAEGGYVRLSKDRSQYILNTALGIIRVERRNVAWFEYRKRIDQIPIEGSPVQTLPQTRR